MATSTSQADVTDDLDYDVFNRLRSFLQRLPPVVNRLELKRQRDRSERATADVVRCVPHAHLCVQAPF